MSKGSTVERLVRNISKIGLACHVVPIICFIWNLRFFCIGPSLSGELDCCHSQPLFRPSFIDSLHSRSNTLFPLPLSLHSGKRVGDGVVAAGHDLKGPYLERSGRIRSQLAKDIPSAPKRSVGVRCRYFPILSPDAAYHEVYMFPKVREMLSFNTDHMSTQP